MEKKECIDLLNKKGYLTQEVDGIISIHIGEGENITKTIDTVTALVKEKGYAGSYGFKWKNPNPADSSKEKAENKKHRDVMKETMNDNMEEAISYEMDLDESDEGQMTFLF